ncbi:hypothetical protein HDV05_002704, partial [Chytridiales sp. JEL 0842]
MLSIAPTVPSSVVSTKAPTNNTPNDVDDTHRNEACNLTSTLFPSSYSSSNEPIHEELQYLHL